MGNTFSVKAAMMIVDVAKFFIEKGSQIMELVDAFVQSVSAIAAGSVGKVAEMIERALSLSVPLLIGMFTSLLGLGDLADKVKKIFKKITGRITGAIDGFIEKAGAWFKDKKGRRKERKAKKEQEKQDKKKGATDKDKNKNKEEDDDNNKDKRSDKEQKKAAEKGLKIGASIVNNKQLNIDQIKVDLKKAEKKQKLKDLEANLTQETEQWHTFMLTSKVGKHKRTQSIKREPTKADKEAHVNEADRALHTRLAAEVKTKLEAKGKSTEGVETFEAFYELLKTEASVLQKEYQPKLRNGIKIAVDLVNSVKEDAKDGDVDVKVRIAPNDGENKFSLDYDKNKHELPQAVKKGNDILATYRSSAMHPADITNIQGEQEDKTVDHVFKHKNFNNKKDSNVYKSFIEKWEAGTIKELTAKQNSRIKHAANQPEPIANLILGTVGTYSRNLRNDLKELFKTDSPDRKAFLELYAQSDTDFNTALAGLLDRNKLTHKDIKNVFKGYEAHHVIPANFLYENKLIHKLLAQKSITFGFNNLDNLVYIPTDKHRENGQFCHKEYDRYITSKIITSKIETLIGDEEYEDALDELKIIISEVKARFKNEVLKPNGITLDKM